MKDYLTRGLCWVVLLATTPLGITATCTGGPGGIRLLGNLNNAFFGDDDFDDDDLEDDLKDLFDD